MSESFKDQVRPQYESASELTGRESYEFAKLAVEHLSADMKEGDKFPGQDAYKKVMKLVVIAGASNELIEQWQADYEHLEEEFKKSEDAEAFIEELRVKLQETLDELEGAIEDEAEELVESAK